MAAETKKCLSNYDVIMHDGTGYPSFSKLINDCILEADKEIIIIANDKVRPTDFHVKKTLYLLTKGFGLVGLFHFAMFGFTKDLIRTIGFFDERFIGGGQEDRDFGRRLLERDIAVYLSEEVPYVYGKKSTWHAEKAVEFYNKKWEETSTNIKRKIDDEQYDYDLGPIIGEPKWMPFKNSLMIRSSLPSHKSLKFFNERPVDFSQMLCSEL